jgi:hypothetical protein
MAVRRAVEGRALVGETILPAHGAIVMATGIVSIGFYVDRRILLSRVLLAIAAAAWLALGAQLIARAAHDWARTLAIARSPTALTGVAGSAVLGTRLALLGWSWAGIALLAFSLCFATVVLRPVAQSWTTPTDGASLMLPVATEALAVLLATLAAGDHGRAWLFAALPLVLAGALLYLAVMSRFEARHIATARGEHWIAGGALAIVTLASAQVVSAATRLHELTGALGALKVVVLVCWALTMSWLPLLLAAELRHRRLRYDVRRWSTVFPVGMYAVCSFAVGTASRFSGATDFARVWVWFAGATWLAVAAAGGVRTLRA